MFVKFEINHSKKCLDRSKNVGTVQQKDILTSRRKVLTKCLRFQQYTSIYVSTDLYILKTTLNKCFLHKVNNDTHIVEDNKSYKERRVILTRIEYRYFVTLNTDFILFSPTKLLPFYLVNSFRIFL